MKTKSKVLKFLACFSMIALVSGCQQSRDGKANESSVKSPYQNLDSLPYSEQFTGHYQMSTPDGKKHYLAVYSLFNSYRNEYTYRIEGLEPALIGVGTLYPSVYDATTLHNFRFIKVETKGNNLTAAWNEVVGKTKDDAELLPMQVELQLSQNQNNLNVNLIDVSHAVQQIFTYERIGDDEVGKVELIEWLSKLSLETLHSSRSSKITKDCNREPNPYSLSYYIDEYNMYCVEYFLKKYRTKIKNENADLYYASAYKNSDVDMMKLLLSYGISPANIKKNSDYTLDEMTRSERGDSILSLTLDLHMGKIGIFDPWSLDSTEWLPGGGNVYKSQLKLRAAKWLVENGIPYSEKSFISAFGCNGYCEQRGELILAMMKRGSKINLTDAKLEVDFRQAFDEFFYSSEEGIDLQSEIEVTKELMKQGFVPSKYISSELFFLGPSVRVITAPLEIVKVMIPNPKQLSAEMTAEQFQIFKSDADKYIQKRKEYLYNDKNFAEIRNSKIRREYYLKYINELEQVYAYLFQ